MEQSVNTEAVNTDLVSRDFVEFIDAARADSGMHEQLCWILSFGSIERRLLLSTLIGRMCTGNAPEHLVNALRLLLDDGVANTALDLLTDSTIIH
jgi:hypothetical protein